MRFPGFSRTFFALWLAITALAVNAFEQRELGFAVIAATADGGDFHIMPDGSRMAGSMARAMDGHAHDAGGGHTHKGHADCELCGFVADMAAFTPAAFTVLPQPPETFLGVTPLSAEAQLSAAPAPPYAPRAPPSRMG